jgi:hypothetical protein
MLNKKRCQIGSPRGINLRFGYFYTHNILILGVNKLKNVFYLDFFFQLDKFVVYLN